MIALIACALVLLAMINPLTTEPSKPRASDILTDEIIDNTYYVTPTGKKYHREDCIFIKDKKNVERLTDKEYYSGEYDPCQICLPEN